MSHQIVLQFLGHYGYIVLGSALFLELIAFPIPGEFLMMYTGFLVFQGRFNWELSIFIAALGTIGGITSSYWLGINLGRPFFERYGHYIHLGPRNLDRVSGWFQKYGNNLLVFAYFVPGLRHLTGYFSGISRIPWRRFMFRAYLGAFLWAATFISLGKVLGPKWKRFHQPVQKYLFWGCLFLIVVLTLVYLYRSYRVEVNGFFLKRLNRIADSFHSLWRAKAFLSIILLFFLSFSFLMIRLIQNFLANQFHHFNFVAFSILQLVFKGKWSALIHGSGFLVTWPALLLLMVLTLVWIYWKGKDRILEVVFFLLAAGGSVVMEELLQVFFYRLDAVGIPLRDYWRPFPSEFSLVVIAVYGFSAFLLVRHTGKVWVRSGAVPVVIGISVLAGLNRIFYGSQYPGDVLAGWVFGGVWLSLAILWFEIFRVLRQEGRAKKVPGGGC